MITKEQSNLSVTSLCIAFDILLIILHRLKGVGSGQADKRAKTGERKARDKMGQVNIGHERERVGESMRERPEGMG